MDKSWARTTVAFLLVVCSMAVYALVASGHAALEWKDIVNIIVGALVANLTAVVQYYFGSSAGSQAKDATIAEAVKKVGNGINP